MIARILEHQPIVRDAFKKLDYIREEFDFTQADIYFDKMIELLEDLEGLLIEHFTIQEEYQRRINPQVDKLILENMLVREILLRMLKKLQQGAIDKNINVFMFFEEFEEIFKAYFKKESELFISEIKEATTQEEFRMLNQGVSNVKRI
ncbi:MAG: hypothetical protein GXO40_01585 [Epsilonproteobacteria bacterium]|nr:hypothetical protein [Campylobacterota bacterium]